MKTRSDILEFINNYFLDMSGKTYELSAMLDELIEGVPEFPATIWNEEIILKIQEWKKEAGK
jgi:hypothetical protein